LLFCTGNHIRKTARNLSGLLGNHRKRCAGKKRKEKGRWMNTDVTEAIGFS
jgi:hypothetical protein